jgi:hypothetical protein
LRIRQRRQSIDKDLTKEEEEGKVFVSFIFRDDHLPTTSNKHLKFSERQAMMKAIENSITLDDKDDVGEAISGVRTTRYPTITHSLFEYIVAIDINDIN